MYIYIIIYIYIYLQYIDMSPSLHYVRIYVSIMYNTADFTYMFQATVIASAAKARENDERIDMSRQTIASKSRVGKSHIFVLEATTSLSALSTSISWCDTQTEHVFYRFLSLSKLFKMLQKIGTAATRPSACLPRQKPCPLGVLGWKGFSQRLVWSK